MLIIKLPCLENGIFLLHEKRNSRSTNTIIKSYDAEKCEINYIQQKFPLTYNLIDVQARHVFGKGLKRHEIKCAVGFNYHSVREHMFNPLLYTKCDMCRIKENWEHILRFPCMKW